MKILFVGDVVGSVGRSSLYSALDEIRSQKSIDMIIVNGENAAHGKGISRIICDDFFEAGVDVITMGNHVWQNKDIFKIFDEETSVIRPANLASTVPGKGSVSMKIGDTLVGVVNLLGRVYLDPCDSPFEAAEREISELKKKGCSVIIVDMHAEATSEKMALGWYLDGKVSAVLGTHTHIQTADEKILSKGTAYITDVGMTGAYYSVLGMDRSIIVKRFATGLPQRFELAEGAGQFNGVMLDIDEASGKCRKIERLAFADL